MSVIDALQRITQDSYQDSAGVFHPMLNSDRIRIAQDALLSARNAQTEILKVLEKVAAYGADQMWHVRGGNLGSHVQTLYGAIEATIARVKTL